MYGFNLYLCQFAAARIVRSVRWLLSELGARIIEIWLELHPAAAIILFCHCVAAVTILMGFLTLTDLFDERFDEELFLLERRFKSVPVHAREETWALDWGEGRSQGWISLEDRL